MASGPRSVPESVASAGARRYLASGSGNTDVPHRTGEIRKRLLDQGKLLVVLDDDPTGTQTVHDVPVLTGWSYSELRWAFERNLPVVYVLTNSRSLPEARARSLNREIVARLARIALDTGRDFDVISRSDSTLRGHFPAETETVCEVLSTALGRETDGVVVCPAFFEAGRLTLEDVHWVERGEDLTPVARTEFAADSTFAYTSSNLKDWIHEKTGGRVSPEEVIGIGLADIREGGPDRVTELLLEAHDRTPVVVNAAGYSDLEVFVLGLADAEAEGKRFVFRTGPSFVRARGGIPYREPLEGADFAPREGHGLIVAGSHVEQTSRQLERLGQLDGVETVEVNVPSLLRPGDRAKEISRVVGEVDASLRRSDTLVYTSREVVRSTTGESDLETGSAVSRSLVGIVRGVDRSVPVSFILAKGGITSSVVATEGLGVRRARVAGQMLEGIVSAWILQEESDFPELPYVVFPGNVGDDDALVSVVKKMRRGSGPGVRREEKGERA